MQIDREQVLKTNGVPGFLPLTSQAKLPPLLLHQAWASSLTGEATGRAGPVHKEFPREPFTDFR